MEVTIFKSTPEIKGIASFRLFELGMDDNSEPFLISLFGQGLAYALRNKKFHLAKKIMRKALGMFSQNPKWVQKFEDMFPTHELSNYLLDQDRSKQDLKLFRLTGECLSFFPTDNATAAIISLWKKQKMYLNNSSNNQKVNKDLETSWGPMLTALGACASIDKNYINFDKDIFLENEIGQLKSKTEKLLEKRKPLFERYKQLSKQSEESKELNSDFDFRSSIYQIEQQLKPIVRALNELHARTNQLENELSPGNILLQIANNGRNYSGYIRQYAVIGLLLLLRDKSNLNSSTKIIISQNLKRISYNTANEKRFKTFELRLDSDFELGELLHLIKSGLVFLNQDPNVDTYEMLPKILEKLKEKLPDIFSFLGKYPLRLLKTEDKRKLYAEYSFRRYDLIRWTRFSGEINVGEVHNRYLELDNLSKPNSMGITINAFKSLFVSVPSLWHEYQHYHEEGIKNGISNEMEVWAREHIFLRELIMEQVNNTPLQLRHEKLKEVLNDLRKYDKGACLLLREDFRDLRTYQLLFNLISTTYGLQLSPNRAKEIANKFIEKEDEITAESNIKNLFWYPDIKWKNLASTNYEKEIQDILIQRFTQNNFLNISEWHDIVNEPEIKRTLNNWEAFHLKNRLDLLFKTYDCLDVNDFKSTWINRI
ncbi:MAG: hypothetical protein AAGA77_21680 [Bacteroidota bacterium]